ncbi:MAG: HAD family hydrolase [Christensenellales bacterium]|jgi:beta-phosphoglucomutase
MNAKKTYKSVLFDMDGVLVDSEKVITKAAINGLLEYGVSACADDFKPFTGMGEDRFIGGVAEKHGVKYMPEMKKRVYEIYLDIVEDEIYIYPGTLPTLKKLAEMGCKMALASSADMVKVRANLSVAKVDMGIFSAVLSGDDVSAKKPDPEIYLAAAKACGEAPENCLVVEDAVSGVIAAKKAGCGCVAVTTSFDEETLRKAGADYVIGDISSLTALLERIS